MTVRAFIQALIAAVLFGAATPFSKSLLADLQANQLAGVLYLGAAAAMLPWVVKRRRDGTAVLPRDTRNRLNLLGAVVCGGIVGPVLLLAGLQYARAASVSMWLNLEGVATAVLAFLLFREHIGRWTWLGNAGVVAAGIMLSFGEGWAGWIGLLCVGGAAVAWGLDNNFTAVIDGISPEHSTFWKGLIAGGANLAIGLVLSPAHWGWHWPAAIAVGMLSYGLSVTLYIRSAHGLGATRAQMVFAAAPFFGVFLSVIWLGETLSLLQVLAAAVLAGSIVFLFRDTHAHEHAHEALPHEHAHAHNDGHHTHDHDPPVPGTHAHPHAHDALVHRHPHWPDLHHRHRH